MIKRTYADFFRFLMNFISTFAQLLHRNFVYTCYVPHLHHKENNRHYIAIKTLKFPKVIQQYSSEMKTRLGYIFPKIEALAHTTFHI
jgi:hypothetical protein